MPQEPDKEIVGYSFFGENRLVHEKKVIQGEVDMMLKEKSQIIVRVVMGLVFLGVGVKYIIDRDYLWGVIFLIAGVAFVVSLFLKKNGKK